MRGTLYVDGICRYYDGTFLRSEIVWDPPSSTPEDFHSYELKFELLKAGKPCFAFRRKLVPGGTVNLGAKPWPKEIETEITTRHGTVRYVQSWDVDRQIALWEEYLRARHPEGTEVRPETEKPAKCEPGMVCLRFNKRPDPRPKPLDMYAFGEKSVGYLTCPDRSMVLVGFNEYTTCDTALPVRILHVDPQGQHALEFAFMQPQWTKKSIACGLHDGKQVSNKPIYFEQQVAVEDTPVPAIPPPEAGPVPDRLPIELPSPR